MFHFGADYYPEHWPESRWPTDARLMQEAGFTVVRLAEFAWTKIEPSPGKYHFAWLDRAIDLLAAHGISVLLGTPTASPPAWLMNQDETLFRVQRDGRRHSYGNRRGYCPNHPDYHAHSRRIVTVLAEHYAGNENVIGWQIDNEFGDPCYCEICRRAFHEFLKEKYQTLDELNTRWGTDFWSHIYTDWAQIPLPMEVISASDPSLELDFKRFASQSYVRFQQLQIDILREKSPGKPITHNFMEFSYDQINYFDLARSLDFVALDSYPRGFWSPKLAPNPAHIALDLDAARGLKQKNFWMMEQQSGPSGAHYVGETPRPGEIRLWAYQSIAHGADAILFFRWRTCRFGVEQYWHGILDHAGLPNRRYEEVKRMGSELKLLAEIAGSKPQAQTAILVSPDSRFAFHIQPNNAAFNYKQHVRDIYAPLHRRHVTVDILSESADFSAYRLLFAPALYVLPQALAEKLKQFVAQGGTLVLTPRSGVKDEHNLVVDAPLPGLLTELVGAVVEEYDSPAPDMQNHLEFSLPGLTAQPSALGWRDILRPATARVIACYGRDYYAGKPAIVLNQYGQGQVLYIGTFSDETLYEALTDWLLTLSNVSPVLPVSSSIEVTQRGDFYFLLNHSAQTETVQLPRKMFNLLTTQPVETLALAAHEVAILKSV
ncbi:MAG: beta-galactosidase [Anaerolineae bacterium]|nr:MAG: beta-galactosidase [Anaerolineae bacterium]